MAHLRYEAISVTASASGNIVAYSTGVFTGFVQYLKHESATGLLATNVPWSTACTVSVAGEKGLSLRDAAVGSCSWNYSPGFTPVGSSGASTGLVNYFRPIPLVNERIVVTVSSNASTGGAVGEVVKVWIGG